MKNSPRRLLCILLWASAFATCAFADDPEPITVASARPLAAAVQQLEQIYGLPITYEDTRYVHDWETIIDGNGMGHVKEKFLSFTHESLTPNTPLDARKVLAVKAIRAAIQNDAAAHGSKMFRVIETENGFHVIATGFSDTPGHVATFKPLLDTSISISSGQRTIGDFLKEMFQAMNSANDQKIVPGTGAPISWQQTTTISASNEPARSVLERLLKELPVFVPSELNAQGATKETPASWSWRLLCDPNPEYGCALNMHVVGPPR